MLKFYINLKKKYYNIFYYVNKHIINWIGQQTLHVFSIRSKVNTVNAYICIYNVIINAYFNKWVFIYYMNEGSHNAVYYDYIMEEEI